MLWTLIAVLLVVSLAALLANLGSLVNVLLAVALVLLVLTLAGGGRRRL
jgi:hypothetical protein